ncbi:MAG: hypothetical protein H0U35_10885 [Sporichthyaceae bacterium]|nr:hypothetical protein [Sporichthyaceae bacterium]
MTTSDPYVDPPTGGDPVSGTPTDGDSVVSDRLEGIVPTSADPETPEAEAAGFDRSTDPDSDTDSVAADRERTDAE